MEQPAAPAGSPGRGWRGRPPRDVLLLLAGAALVIAFWLVVRLRSLLVMLLISFFLSFALEPPVNLLARRGWRRGLGTAAVFAAIVVAVVVFVGALGSLLVAQIGDLVEAIPGYVEQVAAFVNDRLGTQLSGAELADQLRGNQGVKDFVNGLAAGAVGLSTTLVGLVMQGFTIGLFTFYLVADARGCGGRSARCCPPAARRLPCASGTSPSSRPAATSTPGSCWPPPRPWPRPCSWASSGCPTRSPSASGWGWSPSSSPPSGPTWPAPFRC